MATVYVNDGLSPTAATPQNRVESYDLGGKVRFATMKYTAPATGMPQIGDVLVWVPALPNGARVIPHLTKLYFATGTASSTLTVGDGASAARYLAATAIATAGSAACEAAAASGGTYITGTASGDQMITSTVAGAQIKASQVITLHLAYVHD